MTGAKKHLAATAIIAAIMLAASLGAALAQDDEPKASTYGFSTDGDKITATKDGKQVWEKTLKGDISCVKEVEDDLYAVTEEYVYRLSSRTGTERWVSPRIKDEKTLNIKDSGVFVLTPNTLFRLDPDSGAIKLRYRSSDKIRTYSVLGAKNVVVKSDKRVVLLAQQNGKLLASFSTKTMKYSGGHLLGEVVVLKFDKVIGIYESGTGKKIAAKTPRELSVWNDKKPADALKDILKALNNSSPKRRLETLATLKMMKDKGGQAWLLKAASMEDEDVTQRFDEIAEKLVEIMYGKQRDQSETAEAVVYKLAALDSTGRLEEAINAAYLKEYPEEIPDPRIVLFCLVKMLKVCDGKSRELAFETLNTLTGKKFGFKPDGTMEERHKSIKKWEKWWEDNQGQFAWGPAHKKIKITEE